MGATETMDQQHMMDRWAKYGTPGPEHDHFKKLVGKWDAKIKFWMSADAPPHVGAGVSEFEVVFAGRYMVQRYKGESMGMPFEGIGISGFDRYRGEFFDTWFDSMGTSFMMSRSKDKGDRKEFKSLMDDPVGDRRDVHMRTVASWKGSDTHIIEMFCVGHDGKEFQNMEIVFTRQK